VDFVIACLSGTSAPTVIFGASVNPCVIIILFMIRLPSTPIKAVDVSVIRGYAAIAVLKITLLTTNFE
jgi:hypothetical protein